MKAVKKREIPLLTIGWREWVGLPDLGIESIKAKIDTGARTSALHATHLERFRRHDDDWVRFVVYPIQRDGSVRVHGEAPLVDRREVRSSSGEKSLRPVILTSLRLGEREFEIELTLTNRDAMGFRMLLGRHSLRRRFTIDPGASYLVGRPPPRKRKKRSS